MFSDIFVQLLQERNITAYRVGKDTGISQGLISEYKNGRKEPSLKNLQRLAAYFDVSIDYLTGKQNNEENIEKKAAHETEQPLPAGIPEELRELFMTCNDLSPEETKKVQEYAEILKKARNS